VILVGPPGAGKSTVGPVVAAQMGLSFVDVDRELEREAGMTVSAMLTQLGEGRFRALEGQAVEKLTARVDPMVISPGGGWAAHGRNLIGVRGRAVTVYLRTSATEAARRINESGGRPLLRSGDVLADLERLLMKRETFYSAADVIVPTDGRSPEEVARSVVQLARISGSV